MKKSKAILLKPHLNIHPATLVSLCLSASSWALSQPCASQGKGVNREVQALADAEEGQSLPADLPYTSFTSAGEECFINGLFHSVTFDLKQLQ